MNPRLIRVLLHKEIKDLIWNGQVAVLFMTTLIMILSLYTFQNWMSETRFDIPIFDGLTMPINFIAIIFSTYAQGNLIVEEKEQRTTKLLSLAHVSFTHIFLTKALIVYVLSLILLVCSMVVNDFGFIDIISTSLLITPHFLLFILVGTIIGQLANNTIDVSIYGWPILLFYFAIDGITLSSSIFANLLFIFPNAHVRNTLIAIQQGEVLSALPYLLVPVIWVFIFLFALRKIHNRQLTRQ